jgi:hypothetical protein
MICTTTPGVSEQPGEVQPAARRDLATEGHGVVERASDTIISITLTPTTMTLTQVVGFEVADVGPPLVGPSA